MPEAAGIWHANEAVRQAERELGRQAEVAYQRTVRDYHAAQTNKAGASATSERASPSIPAATRPSASVPADWSVRRERRSRPALMLLSGLPKVV